MWQASCPVPREGPIAQFGQFVDGRLKLLKARTTDIEYIAISHVWGKIKWISTIPNVGGEILASRRKTKFIEKKLPGLVGPSIFWMDTLTVNQRNHAEVIATVQIIPTLFRDAIRTIAIREGGGICSKHYKHSLEEAYLQRLWTLQECLLSHTIEFVIDTPNRPEILPESNIAIYQAQTQTEWLCDSLFVLAHSFTGEKGMPAILNFLRAYVEGGIATRPRPPERTQAEDIYTDTWFWLTQLNSS